ncbi:MAG: GerW family sporulation protein [Clostridiaceae bacterium]|nr:GerW family sporulation protein [Clostridiaceae bacterium]
MSSLSDVMSQTISKIKELVDVNTVIGNPITTIDGTTLIPVSKVTFGFASGGMDGKDKADKPSVGAGSGAGVSIVPIAFIVVSGGNVRMIYIDPPANSSLDKVIDMVPGIIDKFKKEKHQDSSEEVY